MLWTQLLPFLSISYLPLQWHMQEFLCAPIAHKGNYVYDYAIEEFT